jgi:hypothetical protein
MFLALAWLNSSNNGLLRGPLWALLPVFRGCLMKTANMVFGDFLITSYFNGMAYDVMRNGERFFIQGDSASQFRDACVASNCIEVCNEYMDALGEIYA